MATYGAQELEEVYQELTSQVICKCVFETEMLGSMSGGVEGVRAFCVNQLKLTGDVLEAAIARIMKEEVGEHELPCPEGELVKAESYGVNILRRDPELGVAWIGDWMIKAMLKVAASRLQLFVQKRGSKGDVAEMSRVHGWGTSLIAAAPRHVYIMGPDGKPLTSRQFRRVLGNVNTPQGSRSISHDCEYVPVGSTFAFEWRFPAYKLTEADVVNMIAACQNIGLGAARSLENGKFTCDLTVNMNVPAKTVEKQEVDEAKKQAKGKKNKIVVSADSRDEADEYAA